MLIELISEYGLFLLKVITIVVSLIILIGVILNSKKTTVEGNLIVKNLNEDLDSLEEIIKMKILSKKEFKSFIKSKKNKNKNIKNKLFVIDFKGNVRASEIVSLRREISGVLLSYKKGDEVLIRLENSGGTVHEHGLAASQLKRIRDKKKAVIQVEDARAIHEHGQIKVRNSIKRTFLRHFNFTFDELYYFYKIKKHERLINELSNKVPKYFLKLLLNLIILRPNRVAYFLSKIMAFYKFKKIVKKNII